MIESFFSTPIAQELSLSSSINILISALLLGAVISLVYMKTLKTPPSSGFAISLIMLPAIIAMIIFLVGNNVARAFSLAGAFSLIRFRSAPGDPKDIAYVFFTLGVGLACGMGYILYGVLFTLILCIVMIILYLTHYGNPRHKSMELKITVPEDLNYEGHFDDVLSNYTQNYEINRVRTSDFGALFEIFYTLQLKKNINQKEFIDKLRCRNGNLTIVLSSSLEKASL